MTSSESETLANWEAQARLDGLEIPKRLGVCINYGAHIWYQVQAANERILAEQLGFAVEIVDANMNADVQQGQVQQFLASGIDALIYSAADANRAPEMLAPLHAAGIPVVTESIWVESPAVATNAMINEYRGGVKVGRAAGERLRARSLSSISVLDVTVPWMTEGVQRSDGFLDGLRQIIPDVTSVRVDGRADIETSAAAATQALQQGGPFDVLFGVDDESAIGGRKAFERLGMPMDDLVICSFGFSGPQAYDWLTDGTYHIVCAMFPEYQARMLVHAAVYAFNRRPLPRHLVAPCIAITSETLPRFYTKAADGLRLLVEAVKAIPTAGEARL